MAFKALNATAPCCSLYPSLHCSPSKHSKARQPAEGGDLSAWGRRERPTGIGPARDGWQRAGRVQRAGQGRKEGATDAVGAWASSLPPAPGRGRSSAQARPSPAPHAQNPEPPDQSEPGNEACRGLANRKTLTPGAGRARAPPPAHTKGSPRLKPIRTQPRPSREPESCGRAQTRLSGPRPRPRPAGLRFHSSWLPAGHVPGASQREPSSRSVWRIFNLAEEQCHLQ